MKQLPVRGQKYTLAEIVNDLQLDDMPSLIVKLDEDAVLQDSHFLLSELLLEEGWAELKYQYVKTTHEWIPIFWLVPEDKEKFLSLCDVNTTIYTDWDQAEDGYWITPKAFPRKQYYEEE